MAVTINGTTGITTPGDVNTGNDTIAGTLQVGGITTNVYPLVSGTAQASTSGTSIDFTSIPSWVKRITVILNGVSTNGTSQMQVQIGSGSVNTSGYVSSFSFVGASPSFSSALITSGFGAWHGLATNASSGSMTLYLIGSNTWISSSSGGFTDQAGTWLGGGNVTLSGALDRVRITTVNGTDTFDAGSINILYE